MKSALRLTLGLAALVALATAASLAVGQVQTPQANAVTAPAADPGVPPPVTGPVRADVVAYDDLRRALATARCTRNYGPCPNNFRRARHLSSRSDTVGY